MDLEAAFRGLEEIAQAAHTPTPWHLGAMNDAVFVIDRPPRPSTDDMAHEHGANALARFTRDADAKFAVLAVNAHNALAEALSDLYRNEKLDDDDPRLIASREKAWAALKLARDGA